MINERTLAASLASDEQEVRLLAALGQTLGRAVVTTTRGRRSGGVRGGLVDEMWPDVIDNGMVGGSVGGGVG